jgi:hypothetical protein
MKKTLLLALVLFSVVIAPYAQTGKPLKSVLELKMPKNVDDDMPGTRGASVVWHPAQKKYYAAFAGNTGYPLGVFDKDGKLLSNEDLTTMADTRGLWYNPDTKKVCGNGYDEFGWFAYKLDKDGIPTEAEILFEGMFQPGDQSVGVYTTAQKQVLFLNNGMVHMYDGNAEARDSIIIHWGQKKDAETEGHDDMEAALNYNSLALVYTGIKGQELGFLNIADKQIELYNISTGYLAKSLPLPEDAAVESIFNFAYANGIYWLFNIEERKWIGYK